MSSQSGLKFNITPGERDVVTAVFLICLILFLVFVVSVALAEYGSVEYAKKVIEDLPTYIVFAAFLIILYIAAWAKGRTKTEAIGVWYHT